MKKIGLLLIISILSCNCSSNDYQINGSGNIITEERVLDSFTKINCPSTIDVNIIQEPNQNVTVSADDNIINRISTTVINQELTINLIQGNYNDIIASVTVAVPILLELNNSSSANVLFSNFENLDSFIFNNSGSGNIEALGSSENLTINNSGSGSFFGFGFPSNTVITNNSGSGSTQVHSNEVLNGSLSGSGSIQYKGMPVINVDVTGTGNLIDAN